MSLRDRLLGDDADVLADRNFRLLLLASVCSPLGEVVPSPVLDSLATTYGVGDARIGLVMAAYTAPAIVLIPVLGALSDRVGRKPVLVAGLALVGLTGAALPLTTDFRVVLGLRVLQGVGYAGLGPILVASLGDLYEGATEATAQGLRFTAVGLALTGLPLLAGVLGAVDPLRALWLFVIALPVAGAIAVWFVEPTAGHDDEAAGRDVATDGGEGPADDGGGDEVADNDDVGGDVADNDVGDDEVADNDDVGDDVVANNHIVDGDSIEHDHDAGPADDADDADGTDDGAVATVRGVARAIRHPGLAALLVGRMVPSFLWFAFLTYASVLVVRALGGSTGVAGGTVAAASLASAAGTTQVGRVTAATGSRATPMAASLAVTCLGLAGVAVAPSVVLAGTGAVVFGSGFGVLLSLYRSTLTTRAPATVRGGVVSLGESLGRVGSTAAPVATGALIVGLGGDVGAVRLTVLAAAIAAGAVGVASVVVAARAGLLAPGAGGSEPATTS